MTDDIINMLSIAAGRIDGWKYEPLNGHEHDLYAEAADEIERLRRLITEWADAQDDVGGYRVGTSEREVAASVSLRGAVGR